MTATAIQIPRRLTNELLHLAQLSPDAEICGLVGGKNGIPHTCYPIDNISHQPVNRYQLDAKQQIAAMKKLRDNGEELFAIYHSHPAAPAEPSSFDREQAAYQDILYLIISLNTKGVLEMRGFRIENTQVYEVNLELTEEEPGK